MFKFKTFEFKFQIIQNSVVVFFLYLSVHNELCIMVDFLYLSSHNGIDPS